MAIHTDIDIQINLPELDGQAVEAGRLTGRKDALQGVESLSLGALPVGTSLLKLKEKCKAHLAARAEPEAWKETQHLARHFWLDGRLLPFKRTGGENRLEYVTEKPFVSLTYCLDNYVIRTPKQTREWVVDPEMPVRQMLETLHAADKIGPVCCYNVYNAKGSTLRHDASLLEQGTMPFSDLRSREQSRLDVRLKAEILRNAGVYLALFAAVGFMLGFLLRRFGL